MKTHLKWLHQISVSNPSMWEGLTENSDAILIKYCNGVLKVLEDNRCAEFKRIPEAMDSELTEEEMIDLLKDKYIFPLCITT